MSSTSALLFWKEILHPYTSILMHRGSTHLLSDWLSGPHPGSLSSCGSARWYSHLSTDNEGSRHPCHKILTPEACTFVTQEDGRTVQWPLQPRQNRASTLSRKKTRKCLQNLCTCCVPETIGKGLVPLKYFIKSQGT